MILLLGFVLLLLGACGGAYAVTTEKESVWIDLLLVVSVACYAAGWPVVLFWIIVRGV